ncbi:SIMPL domain-containing protein [Mycobacterium sp. CPCC 205372]|uniref:SIMPL domain-containing protein n=1 Tax=Mycobacterium hippophais TaxID=3016340 RepID=A0ABT4PNV1_9MYCO|nr:SIMPL domain-containing protein [Mycobacterium hippophais]MCZ8378251.1 SIMPL domain-containing protein [Mycobacterium hippophais]
MPIAVRAKTLLTTLAAAALTVGALSACDATAGPAAPANTDSRQVTVVGAGQVQGTPDLLTANVSMEFIAPDVTSAMNQSSDRQQAVINALVDAGIERKDINTTQVSLQPQFGPDSVDIAGYRASNSLDVKIRDLGAASQALALIVSTGGDAARINSVNYSIEDDSQFIRDARARAFEDARSRAEQYADLSGLDLGDVVSISEVAGETPPVPMQAPRAAMESVPLEPGQQSVGFTVTVVWELS